MKIQLHLQRKKRVTGRVNREEIRSERLPKPQDHQRFSGLEGNSRGARLELLKKNRLLSPWKSDALFLYEQAAFCC
jgi:hypothetical protein